MPESASSARPASAAPELLYRARIFKNVCGAVPAREFRFQVLEEAALREVALETRTRIRVDTTWRDELVAQMVWWMSRPRFGIHVSDLDFLLKTYYARKHPEFEPTEDEMDRLIAGRGHHAIIEALAASPDYRERYVEWEGIRGHIDFYRGACVEIKTTRLTRTLGPEEFVRDYPHYLKRLGRYCAMVNENQGLLLLFYLGVQEGNRLAPKIDAYRAEFENLDSIRREMLELKKKILYALEHDDSSQLERARPGCAGTAGTPEFVIHSRNPSREIRREFSESD